MLLFVYWIIFYFSHNCSHGTKNWSFPLKISSMCTNPQSPAYLVTFTEEILNGNLYLFWSIYCCHVIHVSVVYSNRYKIHLFFNKKLVHKNFSSNWPVDSKNQSIKFNFFKKLEKNVCAPYKWAFIVFFYYKHKAFVSICKLRKNLFKCSSEQLFLKREEKLDIFV